IADEVGFEQLPSENGSDVDEDDLPFEAIDDHVIHNIQAGPGDFDNYIDIPDVALRHNDIYPRGEWDLTSVSFDLSKGYSGSNTTSRFAEGPVASASNNNGDKVSDLKSSFIADESGVSASARQPIKVTRQDWDSAATVLETTAPTAGATADWDGVSIYLYAGETITLTSEMNGSAVDAILAIDGPNLGGGSDPLGTGQDLNWDFTNAVPITINPDGTISTDTGDISTGLSVSYTVVTTGWHYVGTGFANDVIATGGTTTGSGVSPSIKYNTLIEIDGVPYGEFDYTATDYVLSDGAHVTVDAIDEREYDNVEKEWVDIDTLEGTSGDDIIISGDNGDTLLGNDGKDVLIGRGGDDHLTGGIGRDLFLFEHAETTATTPTDGHDTIYDFSAAEGDIINLDALFDELGVLSADRNLLADNSTAGKTVLTVEDAGGTVVSGFSITLAGSDLDNADIAQLITDGNLVVDQS
ncbi:MAG: type I secretion C-terminal target domain-containing protein, partial [Gammaproteobacteria bacterium]|nr:type I secretion C-terminal target domain-containing protein [Gammaproteobacteria bacterium]